MKTIKIGRMTYHLDLASVWELERKTPSDPFVYPGSLISYRSLTVTLAFTIISERSGLSQVKVFTPGGGNYVITNVYEPAGTVAGWFNWRQND